MVMEPFRESFRDMMTLRDAMERLMEDAFVSPRRWTTGPRAETFVPCDFCESQNEFLVRCSLPGVRPEDLDVSVVQDTLTLRGRFGGRYEEEGRHLHEQTGMGQQSQQQQQQGREGRQREQEQWTGWNCHFREIPTGTFTRTITLPAPVDPEHVEATFEHGVLTLRLPKTAEVRPRRIQIRAGGQERSR